MQEAETETEAIAKQLNGDEGTWWRPAVVDPEEAVEVEVEAAAAAEEAAEAAEEASAAAAPIFSFPSAEGLRPLPAPNEMNDSRQADPLYSLDRSAHWRQLLYFADQIFPRVAFLIWI